MTATKFKCARCQQLHTRSHTICVVCEHEQASHGSMTAHTFLTDQGCYVHTHIEAYFDNGDAENGPGDSGNPPYDLYEGDSHDLILERGLLVW